MHYCLSDSSAQRCEVSTIIIPKPRMRKLSLREVSSLPATCFFPTGRLDLNLPPSPQGPPQRYSLPHSGSSPTLGGNRFLCASVSSSVKRLCGLVEVLRSFQFWLLFFKLFIYFWLCRVFVATQAFSSSCGKRDYSLEVVCGFLLQWLLLLQITGSRALTLQQMRHVGSAVAAPGL